MTTAGMLAIMVLWKNMYCVVIVAIFVANNVVAAAAVDDFVVVPSIVVIYPLSANFSFKV